MEIKTFGPIDERSRKQLETCMKAGDADFGVLCADHHPGYSQPIGGAIAYEGYISPSGVGYDIACVAAGEAVETAHGYTLPVERAVAPVCADAVGMLRPVEPFIGTVARGGKLVVRVVLANGRSLICTGDHQIRTERGWAAAASLSTDDSVLCPVYTGLPFEPCDLPVELLRVAGYVNGDGHISANGRRVSLYTSVPHDARALEADLRSLGYEPRIHARTRPNGSHESAVYVNSRELTERLAVFCPVGSKEGRWGHVLDALRPLPRWARGAYLSAFASAEMSTPPLLAGNIPSLAIKQKGRDAIEVVADLLRSLDFTVGVTRSDRGSYVAQLQGGEDEQIRFMAEIGFSRAAGKRGAAAVVVGHAWARQEHIATRRRAQNLVREHVRAGAPVRMATAEVAADGLTQSTVHHLLYRRGTLRRALGWECAEPRALGECAWSSVASVEPAGERETWDIVTQDPEEAFVAGGIAVHNCGNKAVRTDMTRADLGAVEPVMAEIARRVSFGMGVPAREQVDHPVLAEIERAAFEPQRKLAGLARKQLGTVGSGNHYVNLFADEEGTVWVGVHFGSRGFGHKTAAGFLAMAQGLPFDEGERKRLGLKVREGGMDSPPVLFEVDSEVGQSYIEAMQLAGRYAYAGRDAVVDKVLEILGARAVHEVHNHHNFCIPADQIVPTTTGPKRMDEISPGEQVYAYSDEGPLPTTVTDHWCAGEKEVMTISLGARRLRCSPEHPILILDEGKTEWRTAAQLTIGTIVVCAEGYYPRDRSVGHGVARLVGAFLGDGWIRHDHVERRGYTLDLAIGRGSEAHTFRYARLAEELLPNMGWGKGWRIDAPGHFGLSCSSKSAYEAAVALGIGERAAGKRVPSWAFEISVDEKLALLGGYFDADGSVANANTSNHGRGSIAAASKRLVEDLRELVLSCGLHATPVRAEQRTTNYGEVEVYRCALDAASTAQLPLWHEAKAANQRVPKRRSNGLTPQYLDGAELPDGFLARRVRTVELGPPEPVYDLTVEHDSHSFIVEGVVTHNCWREEHAGRSYWVVRKGCTPAEPGQEGFVGATMGDDSVILEGVDSADAQEALRSTVHGAGRVMSRSQAAGRVKRRTVYECSDRDCDFAVPAKEYEGESCPRHPGSRMRKLRKQTVVRKGVVDWPAVQERLRRQGIVLVGGGADEAPEVYKDLKDVLAAHEGTIRVKHTLTPLGVAMAGADVLDPYKD